MTLQDDCHQGLKQNQIIAILSFTLGATSAIGQVLLLRELIVVFYGNETAYAVILASWLFWIAVGSSLTSLMINNVKSSRRFLIIFLSACYFFVPATLVAVRLLRVLLDSRAGEIIGLTPMVFVSFTVLAPLTFVLGGVFAIICSLSNDAQKQSSTNDVGTVYLWEALGAACGGLIYSFVLIHLLPAIHTAFFVGLSNIAAMMLFVGNQSRVFKGAAFVFFITLVFYPLGGMKALDQLTRHIQWKHFQIVTIMDSIYGNIVLTKMADEYSLFENGLLSYSTKDELASEENVHYALLEHPRPKHVLLIGNGIGGGVREILKHPVDRVDYIELDPKVIDVSLQNLPAELTAPLEDKRVEVIHTDARLWVKRAIKEYDVIIVNLSDPYTALINRYYTVEFFKEAGRILSPTGLLSLSVSSSENYMNTELRSFLRSVNSTLKRVYPQVISIPGDKNIFLASKKDGMLTSTYEDLLASLRERGITTKYVSEYYLPFKLSEDRVSYIEKVLKEEGSTNTDTRPIAYLYDIVLWSTHFNTTFKEIIQKVEGIKPSFLPIPFLFLLFIGWLRTRYDPTFPITASIVTTGLSEMMFQLIVILAFQTLYGFAYYKIGFIMASFMVGLVLGVLAAKKLNAFPTDSILRIYRFSQLGICIYPLLLPFLFIVFRDTVISRHFMGLFASTFATLPVIAGFLGGVQYPLAIRLLHTLKLKENGKIVRLAGLLYAADVLGASVGALVTGALLIPLWGITAVAYFCAVLNAIVLIWLSRCHDSSFQPAR